jgi:hypothetical protein
MKKLFTGIICLILSTTLSAQNTNSESENQVITTNVLFKSGNSIYLKNIKDRNTAIKIKKLQNMVATYNIKNAAIYNSKRKSITYDVVFEESNCKIVATYNNKGTIINTTEQFTNMKLPNKLCSEIAKEYPYWSLTNNTQIFDYTASDGATKIYMVQIKKDRKLKTLKFKMTVTETALDYVAVN